MKKVMNLQGKEIKIKDNGKIKAKRLNGQTHTRVRSLNSLYRRLVYKLNQGYELLGIRTDMYRSTDRWTDLQTDGRANDLQTIDIAST